MVRYAQGRAGRAEPDDHAPDAPTADDARPLAFAY